MFVNVHVTVLTSSKTETVLVVLAAVVVAPLGSTVSPVQRPTGLTVLGHRIPASSQDR